MSDLWERFKHWIDGSDRAAARLEYFEWRMERHREDVERRRVAERAELRDRFAIEIVGSLILRMPLDIDQITPAMCKTVWTIADAMLKERDQ
jgi:hypothetical protein